MQVVKLLKENWPIVLHKNFVLKTITEVLEYKVGLN